MRAVIVNDVYIEDQCWHFVSLHKKNGVYIGDGCEYTGKPCPFHSRQQSNDIPSRLSQLQCARYSGPIQYVGKRNSDGRSSQSSS